MFSADNSACLIIANCEAQFQKCLTFWSTHTGECQACAIVAREPSDTHNAFGFRKKKEEKNSSRLEKHAKIHFPCHQERTEVG